MDDQQITGWVGWIAFASFMLMFEGVMQVIYGFAALFNQTWYVSTTSGVYLFNIATWGWISLVLGALVFLSGILLQTGNMLGRIVGIVFVTLAMANSLATIAFTPLWSMLALVVDVLVGYAILAHGKEMKVLPHA